MRRVLLLLVCGSAWASPAWLGVSWSSEPPTEVEKPPRPIVTSHGKKDYAKRGSYCWTQADGSRFCAEAPTLPVPTRRFVPVHAGGQVLVNLRHPGDALVVRLRRTGEDPWVPAAQLDTSGKRWIFSVPATLKRSKQVILEADYHEWGDDAIFGIKLRLHRH